jgi:hypothetical protein
MNRGVSYNAMKRRNEEAKAPIPMEIVIRGRRNMFCGNTTLRHKSILRTQPRYPASPPLAPFMTPAAKKPRLDPRINSTAVVTNAVIDLCSDSEDDETNLNEKPSSINVTIDTIDAVIDLFSNSYDKEAKLNDKSSSIEVIIDTIDSLLRLRRLPVATAAAEAATTTALTDVAMVPPSPPPSPPTADVDVDDDDDDDDDVANTDSDYRRWTLEEDAELASAVGNTGKIEWGVRHRIDWAVISSLVQGRTRNQCSKRWHAFLKESLAPAIEELDTVWTTDEDSKLTSAVQRHGGKKWVTVAKLLPGRTKIQCKCRWNDFLKHSIDQAAVRLGTWTEDEDNKLKDAVHIHRGKQWGIIATLVPGRTKAQCSGRWYSALNPSVVLTAGHSGKWTEDEDNMLTYAIHVHGDKGWTGITALVPGRTRKQCHYRWHKCLNSTLTAAYIRPWTEDEDVELLHALQMYGGKKWDAITALVPLRSKRQCHGRWYDILKKKHIIDLTTGPSLMWTREEESKLKDAVQTHGSNDWVVIAELIPGRTKNQCLGRWIIHMLHTNVSTVQKEEIATLNTAPALGQDPNPRDERTTN